jgi:hypothetical protein
LPHLSAASRASEGSGKSFAAAQTGLVFGTKLNSRAFYPDDHLRHFHLGAGETNSGMK